MPAYQKALVARYLADITAHFKDTQTSPRYHNDIAAFLCLFIAVPVDESVRGPALTKSWLSALRIINSFYQLTKKLALSLPRRRSPVQVVFLSVFEVE